MEIVSIFNVFFLCFALGVHILSVFELDVIYQTCLPGVSHPLLTPLGCICSDKNLHSSLSRYINLLLNVYIPFFLCPASNAALL